MLALFPQHFDIDFQTETQALHRVGFVEIGSDRPTAAMFPSQSPHLAAWNDITCQMDAGYSCQRAHTIP